MDQLDDIAEQGYTIVPDAIDPDLVDELVADLGRLERDLGIGAGHATTSRATTPSASTTCSPTARCSQQVPVHPAVLPVVEGVLDPGCLISSLSSIAIDPGETIQPIHADDQLIPIPKPAPARRVQHHVGAHRLHRGQRRHPHHPRHAPARPRPDYGRPYDSIPAEMPKGSVLIWHGSLWHGGGANTTADRRIGIAMNYCAGYIRQQENQQLGIPREIAATFGPRLRELVGYGIYHGLIGHIDKRSPAELLGEPPGGERGDSSMVWDRM